MKSINYILVIFIGLSVCNAFGKVEYLPMPQNQSVGERTKSNVSSAFGKLPLHFVANEGQLDKSVVYYAKSEDATVYCTEEGLVFGFAEGSISLKFNAIATPSLSLRAKRSNLEAKQSLRVKPEARGELKGKVNYFIGNDPALWRTNIPTFAEVVYRDVYPGVDLVYSGNQRRLKYTFYIQPNSHPNQIQMIYDGIEDVWVDGATGELVIQTEWGEMRDAAPVAYQEIEGVRKAIDISFRLVGEKRVGFALGDYDPNFKLVIDSGYSTYLGGSGTDWGYDIALDSSGNAYVTGYTFSSNFPTQNPYQGSRAGNGDVFVTKFSSSGNTLIYSTYLGGSTGHINADDTGWSIAVDNDGNAYVAGDTKSFDFPTTPNAYQSVHKDGVEGYDAFVTKLSSNGDTLLYSTFLGGCGDDKAYCITVDNSGNAYVTGYTGYCTPDGFPTKNAYQPDNAGFRDAFVTKIDTTQSGEDSLIYSTYLGGSKGDDLGTGIAVDNSGNAYILGTTYSSDFPTQNPYDSTLSGTRDAFVSKLSSSGKTLMYSTYLGGGFVDNGWRIVVDDSANAYATGWTMSSSFPTKNAYQSSLGGDEDAFVTQIDTTQSGEDSLIYSTYLGGSDDDVGIGIGLNSGNLYVTGKTESSDFPTQNPYQPDNAGLRDAFVTKFSSSGDTLIYSTYLGGKDTDKGRDIAVDSNGNAYVTGWTFSFDFPTLNPYQDSWAGESDVFVASFLSDGALPVELSLLTAIVSPDGVTLRWRTESETNNLGFDIYRSDAKEGPYTKVNATRIPGAGTDVTPHDYSFTDEQVVFGKTYYYYIEDVDFAGKKGKSPILQITVSQESEVKIINKSNITVRSKLKPVVIPTEFALLQNYPNPFNPETWLPYELAKDATVTIRIYDVNGQVVRQLDLGKQKAGRYVDKRKAAYWDGKDQNGKAVSSGIYFYTLKAGDFQATRRMVIVK